MKPKKLEKIAKLTNCNFDARKKAMSGKYDRVIRIRIRDGGSDLFFEAGDMRDGAITDFKFSEDQEVSYFKMFDKVLKATDNKIIISRKGRDKEMPTLQD